ncbi:hypothetical protein BRN33_06000, partial [Xanthomonas oryzae pv. oryzae]
MTAPWHAIARSRFAARMRRNQRHAARTDRPQTARCALARRAAQHCRSGFAACDRRGDRTC